VKVPANLRDFLMRLRYPSEPRYLWADAICINQSDDQERGHQVKKNMGLIYAKAKRVIAWLGSDGFDDFDDFNELADPGKAEPFPLLMREYCSDLNQDVVALQRSNTVQLQPKDLDYNTEHEWITFANLLCRRWFSRLWVVQEAGLGKSVLAMFGEKEMDFDNLMILAACLSWNRLLIDHFRVNVRLFFSFSVFPTRFQAIFDKSDGLHGVDLDFLEVLQDSRMQRATNPRDRVYALLGHPSALVHGRLIVEPDYNKSKSDLFLELAVKLIEETNSLRVLSAVHRRKKESSQGRKAIMDTNMVSRKGYYCLRGRSKRYYKLLRRSSWRGCLLEHNHSPKSLARPRLYF